MLFKLPFSKIRHYNVVSRSVLVVSVELLDSSTLECTLSADSTGQHCLQNVAQRIGLGQPEFFGLQYISKRQYPKVRWVELDRPLKKQLEKYAQSSALSLSVFYYIHDVGLLQDDTTRSHFFLQVKQDVLEGKLRCNYEQAVLLASYSLQAEFGDQQPDRHTPEYLKDFLVLPKLPSLGEPEVTRLLELAVWQYASLRGLAQALAETYYILEAQRLEGYGQETFMARDERNSEVYLGASLVGVTVRPASGQVPTMLRWNDISNLVNLKRAFAIECPKNGSTYQFTFDEPDVAKYIWKMCVKQHTFFKQHNQQLLERSEGEASSPGSAGCEEEVRSLAIPDLQRSVMSSSGSSGHVTDGNQLSFNHHQQQQVLPPLVRHHRQQQQYRVTVSSTDTFPKGNAGVIDTPPTQHQVYDYRMASNTSKSAAAGVAGPAVHSLVSCDNSCGGSGLGTAAAAAPLQPYCAAGPVRNISAGATVQEMNMNSYAGYLPPLRLANIINTNDVNCNSNNSNIAINNTMMQQQQQQQQQHYGLQLNDTTMNSTLDASAIRVHRMDATNAPLNALGDVSVTASMHAQQLADQQLHHHRQQQQLLLNKSNPNLTTVSHFSNSFRRALLPEYRPAPDYHRVMAAAVGSSSGNNNSTGIAGVNTNGSHSIHNRSNNNNNPSNGVMLSHRTGGYALHATYSTPDLQAAASNDQQTAMMQLQQHAVSREQHQHHQLSSGLHNKLQYMEDASLIPSSVLHKYRPPPPYPGSRTPPYTKSTSTSSPDLVAAVSAPYELGMSQLGGSWSYLASPPLQPHGGGPAGASGRGLSRTYENLCDLDDMVVSLRQHMATGATASEFLHSFPSLSRLQQHRNNAASLDRLKDAPVVYALQGQRDGRCEEPKVEMTSEQESSEPIYQNVVTYSQQQQQHRRHVMFYQEQLQKQQQLLEHQQLLQRQASVLPDGEQQQQRSGNVQQYPGRQVVTMPDIRQPQQQQHSGHMTAVGVHTQAATGPELLQQQPRTERKKWGQGIGNIVSEVNIPNNEGRLGQALDATNAPYLLHIQNAGLTHQPLLRHFNNNANVAMEEGMRQQHHHFTNNKATTTPNILSPNNPLSSSVESTKSSPVLSYSDHLMLAPVDPSNLRSAGSLSALAAPTQGRLDASKQTTTSDTSRPEIGTNQPVVVVTSKKNCDPNVIVNSIEKNDESEGGSRKCPPDVNNMSKTCDSSPENKHTTSAVANSLKCSSSANHRNTNNVSLKSSNNSPGEKSVGAETNTSVVSTSVSSPTPSTLSAQDAAVMARIYATRDPRARQLQNELLSAELPAKYRGIMLAKPNASYATPPEGLLAIRRDDCSAGTQNGDRAEATKGGATLPYIDNCVKLQQTADNKQGFLNASHITASIGQSRQVFYVVQAIGPEDTAAVWRCVWEHDVRVVVMLAHCFGSQQHVTGKTSKTKASKTSRLLNSFNKRRSRKNQKLQQQQGKAENPGAPCDEGSEDAPDGDTQERNPLSSALCFPYWPQFDNTSMECGAYRIQRRDSTHGDGYTISRLQMMQCGSAGGSRTVWHLHYQHGLTNARTFIELVEQLASLREVSQREAIQDALSPGFNVNTPILLQCPSGTEHCGALMLCDIMVGGARDVGPPSRENTLRGGFARDAVTDTTLNIRGEGSVLDPAKILPHLRQQRANLVPEYDMFKFVYRVMIEYFGRSRLI